MKDIEFISDSWCELLQHNQIDNFETLWQFEQGNWFEAPNYRRGGWSGVSRSKLAMPDGSEVCLYIKRQENHVYHSWQHLFRPMATFEREYRNIMRFQQHGIPTVDLIYFGQRMVDGKLRAILITHELESYQALDALMKARKFSRKTQAKLFSDVAMAMRSMHTQQFQHNCLYPKHLFIREYAAGQFDTRFIDLEKTKRWPFKRNAALRDLGTLHRHTENMSRTDRLRFFLAYRQEKHLSVQSKKMLVKLTKKKASIAGDASSYEIDQLPAKLQEVS